VDGRDARLGHTVSSPSRPVSSITAGPTFCGLSKKYEWPMECKCLYPSSTSLLFLCLAQIR
jgi:hypothetical protein